MIAAGQLQHVRRPGPVAAKPRATVRTPATISRGSPNRGTRRRIRPPWTTALSNPSPAKANAAERASQPIRGGRKSESVPSSAAKARIDRKPSKTSWPTPGRRDRVDESRASSPPARPRGPARPGAATRGASGSTSTQASVEKPAATRKGRRSRQAAGRAGRPAGRPAADRARSPARTPCRSGPSPAPGARAA